MVSAKGTRARHEHVLGHAPGGAEARPLDLELGLIQAVVLGAGRTGPAHAAAPRPVHHHGVALPDAADTGAEPGDDAGAFMPEGQRQSHPVVLGREAHEVLVRVADTCSGHPEQDLTRTWLRRRYLPYLRGHADRGVLQRLHALLLARDPGPGSRRSRRAVPRSIILFRWPHWRGSRIRTG